MIVETMAARPATDDRLRRLTDRERDVLRLVAEGHSNRSIAALLVINDKTVETHIAHIFQKLDLGPSTDHHRRVLAALRWLDR
jgi:DNA-binding NarL/FixJ family response regulator